MDLLIVGASARAAAFSALRAGLIPRCIDLFADRDLAANCPSHRVDPGAYPEGLARLADRVEPISWFYTGALENHPVLVDEISKKHVLLGNRGAVLRAVRDPIAVAGTMHAADLDAPDVCLDANPLPADGSWLVKPRASGGGRGIRPWQGGRVGPGSRVYYQRRVGGLSLSALFVAGHLGTSCLGVTRQFVGRPGNRFAYRGTLAPWPVAPAVQDQIELIGHTIATHFHLTGLFGIDLILEDDRAWLIEINPRYTAAVEALEWATGKSFLTDHLASFGITGAAKPLSIQPRGFVGKAIVHADRTLTWTEDVEFSSRVDEMPEVADIPGAGTSFEAGDPVLTVLAHGVSPAECRRALAARVRDWKKRIARPRP